MEQKKLVKKIFNEVIKPGNCFHCGLCEGLSNNLFKMTNSINGPIPKLMRKPTIKDIPDLKKIISTSSLKPAISIILYLSLFNFLINQMFVLLSLLLVC